MVSSDARFLLLDEAADGETAWTLIQTSKPRIAVLDIDMPVISGLELARRIHDADLPIVTVILTIHKTENILNAALDAGAKGYILKEDTVSDLVHALNTVANGGLFLSPSISSFLLTRSRRLEELRSHRPALDDLTPMELRVLKMVGENKTNREIGKRLFISPRTVHTHRNNICTKLNLHGTRGLLMFALENREALHRIPNLSSLG